MAAISGGLGGLGVLLRWLGRRLVVSARSARLFRYAVALALLLDCAERWPVLEWMYTDTGGLPRSAMLPELTDDPLAWLVCVHAWRGSLQWAQALLLAEAAAALGLAFGSRACGVLAWWLHLSVCVRSAPLIYILDRYLNVLLIYATLLPTPSASGEVSLTSVAIALQLVFIYVDASTAKLFDPGRTWSLDAPVAALDTYFRHTPVARLLHRVLGGSGLRLAGTIAVAIELLAAPLMLLAPTRSLRRLGIAVAVLLHLGIALTMRNTTILSFAAVAMWLPFLDGPATNGPSCSAKPIRGVEAHCDDPKWLGERSCEPTCAPIRSLSSITVALFMGSAMWHQWHHRDGPGCGGRAPPGVVHRAILHNRWNVFGSAEAHVVWEIAPARLSDGSIVDIWRGTEHVSWEVPEDEDRVHSGRWRSLPITAERDEQDDFRFWSMLCDEWEARERERWAKARADMHGRHSSAFETEAPNAGEQSTNLLAPRTIVGFHFYLLQADVVPAPRKWGWPFTLLAQATGMQAVDPSDYGHTSCKADPVTAASVCETVQSEQAASSLAHSTSLYGPVRKRLLRSFSCSARP